METLRDIDTGAIAEILEQRIKLLDAERGVHEARMVAIDRDLGRLRPALDALRDTEPIAEQAPHEAGVAEAMHLMERSWGHKKESVDDPRD